MAGAAARLAWRAGGTGGSTAPTASRARSNPAGHPDRSDAADPVRRPSAGLRRVTDRAKLQGWAIVDSGVADARTLLRDSIDEGLTWAERRALPRLVDALVPHLVTSVAPRIIDGLLPHLERAVTPRLIDAAIPILRARVLPVVIQDLTDNPLLRKLLLEQSRGVVSQAADGLRNATARADDRVEGLFRGMVHRDRER
jgi:hypothetical protein